MFHIGILFTSKFDFTANSLGTNTVIITRVFCYISLYRVMDMHVQKFANCMEANLVQDQNI